MKKNILVIGLVVLIITGCDFLDSLSEIPRAPLWVIATPQSKSSITVTWEGISKAEKYEVYCETDGTSIQLLGTTAEASYTHEGLDLETAYAYFVKAKNSSGTSNFSLRSNATTPVDVDNTPRAPYYVSATAKQDSTIEVTWREVSNATSYAVYYETDSNSVKQHLGDTAETTYIHTDLTSGTTYTYYIKAINSYGDSDFSTKSNSVKPIESVSVARGTSPDDAITITSEGVSGYLLPVSGLSELWYTFTKDSSGTLSVKDKASGEYSADIMADIYTKPPPNGEYAKVNSQNAINLNLGTTGLTSITLDAGTYYVKVSLYPSLLNMGSFWLSFE
jgi:hypothetical protein